MAVKAGVRPEGTMRVFYPRRRRMPTPHHRHGNDDLDDPLTVTAFGATYAFN